MPDLSPDGRWLAYVSNESGRNEVFVRAFPGGGSKRQVSTNGGLEPAWSRNGRKLAFVAQDPAPHGDMAQFVEVDVTPGEILTLGRPHVLFDTPFDGATAARSYDLTADAQRFLTVREIYPPAVTAPRDIHFVQGWLDDLRARAGTRPKS